MVEDEDREVEEEGMDVYTLERSSFQSRQIYHRTELIIGDAKEQRHPLRMSACRYVS